MRKFLICIILAGSVNQANADIYKVFWPEENQKGTAGWDAVKIVNISSNTVLDGSMSGVYTQDLSALTSGASAANSGATYQITHSLDATGGGGPTVIDFSGSNITLRAESGIAINPDGGATPAYVFDVVYKVDASTGKVSETRLVASSAAEATLADAAGFTVDLEESSLSRSGAGTSFQSYASNVTNEGTVNIQTKGGLVTEQLSNPDGSSLLRKENDGTVHIGKNSIVLADELVSSSGNDEVYSSSGVLQLGNNANHRTIIKGSIEVPKPTKGVHAANKSYVDSMGAMLMAASNLNYSIDPSSGLSLGIGLGYMDGENALAVGIGGSNQNSNMNYTSSISYSDYTNQVSIGAGVSWSLK